VTQTGKQLPPYSIAICKGAALLDETQNLLRFWKPGESSEAFAQRALARGVLSSATAYRARDIVKRVFVRRYLTPNDVAARWMKAVLDAGLSRKTYIELLFLFACRCDPLVHDFTVRGYWPACRRNRAGLSNEDVVSFIDDAAEHGRIPKPWSTAVKTKIARGVLGLLRDCGFLRDGRNGQRELSPYHLSDGGLACIARILHDEGYQNAALCGHPDWLLFGMQRDDVAERLDDLGEARGLLVQRAGSVINLTWRVQSMEELLNVLA
jgi:hypothetical protein